MSTFRSKLLGSVPPGLRPLARRQVRQFNRLRGTLFAHKRPGVVLMLHVGRCGSTVLANLLEQNPAVHWDGKLPRKALQLYGENVSKLDHTRWVAQQFATSGSRFYGFEFKILADQYPAIFGTTTEDFLHRCREIGVTHYILLLRRNTLRHVVSHYASKNRGSWHAGSGDSVQKKEFSLDTDNITTGRAQGRKLTEYLREVDTEHMQVRNLLAGENLLEIEYERDIDEAGAEHAYHRVCAFLNILPGEVHIRNSKMNPYPLEAVLGNYDEVVQALDGTDFAWMSKS